MQYINEILMLLSWPLLIFIAYVLGRLGLKNFDKNNKKLK
jgi:hypothetical protein